MSAFLRETEGSSAIEYALIGAIVLAFALPAILSTTETVSTRLYALIGALAGEL